MFSARVIQLISAGVMAVAFICCGALLPAIIHDAEKHTLRYTNDSWENAPPEVVLGQAVGAVRGILVDVLWMRATMMKERGLYYEANTLADMITKLQPRFAPVWTMHGHNMAYNISVATHTEAERWEWVKKGIDLVRLRGLRYNPNNIVLYKDLSYWFHHKIEGLSDDAHLFYKREFAKEWHLLLGEPPYAEDDRQAWIDKVANAPDTLEEAISREPLVKELVDRLSAALSPYERVFKFGLNKAFLMQHGAWNAVQSSWYSEQAGLDQSIRSRVAARQEDALAYVAFDEIASDPKYAEALDVVISYVRKKVLREDYNMDAEFMASLHEEFGPIDWRHAAAHALYWSQMGEEKAEARSRAVDDIYNILNNDRMTANAIQTLARFGLVQYDPVSNEFPSRMADTRFIETVQQHFQKLYKKHEGVRGWGPDNFIAWHEHFLQSTVRELYRMGERTLAQHYYDELDSFYGTGHIPPNTKYSDTLENFVMNETKGEYEMQPHVATTDVQSALYYAVRRGLAVGNKEIYDDAKEFADQVLQFFKQSDWHEFTNKFGRDRIAGIIADLEGVEQAVWRRIMMDPLVPIQERITLWQIHMPLQHKQAIYDDIREGFAREITMTKPHLANQPFEQILPEPPGMEAYRRARAARQQQTGRTAPEIDG